MKHQSVTRPRRSYWLLVVFAALMLVPPVWAAVALTVIAAASILIRSGAALARAHERNDAGTIVLGTDTGGKTVVLGEEQLAAHGLILGASGAGKSTTLLRILTDQIRRGQPVIAIDLKGSPSFARVLADAAEAAGRPFACWTPDGPSHWNPLQHGNATELKDKLVSTERFTEPHYQRAAERYVQTVLQVLAGAHPGRPPTLEEVVALMDPQRLSRLLRGGQPLSFGDRVQDYLSALTPDQLSAVRGLATRLAILSESHVGRYLAPAPGGGLPPASSAGSRAPAMIDLRRALAGEQVVLFSLNSSSYGKLAAQLGTLVVQDLVSAVGHRLGAGGAGPAGAGRAEQAIVGIDEFSALGGDHVISLLARAREAGVSVLLCTQELADLDRAATGLRDQVLGNTAVKIAHRQDVPSSAQTVAQMAGTVRVWEETQQLGAGPLSSVLVGGYPTGRGSRRQVEQFLVHPNEIKMLGTGEAVVITKLPRAEVRTVRVTAPAARQPAPAPRPREGPELG